MNRHKKISPQAIIALKEALAVITWKKDEEGLGEAEKKKIY